MALTTFSKALITVAVVGGAIYAADFGYDKYKASKPAEAAVVSAPAPEPKVAPTPEPVAPVVRETPRAPEPTPAPEPAAAPSNAGLSALMKGHTK